jgi:hypothetical protein
MLEAHESLLQRKYVSAELSPRTVWLTALYDYVSAIAPGDVNTVDRTVRKDAFYRHLETFLEAQVRSESAYAPHRI